MGTGWNLIARFRVRVRARPGMVRCMDDLAALTDDTAWQSVCDRDRASDGRFVFAVRSTGIYCRPSCPARRPKRENVCFFASAEQAREAGFRACRRCRPDEVSREEVALALALDTLAGSEERVPLERLAASVGYSPAHFQRLFTRAVGISPAAYQRALRIERVATVAGEGGTVTEAIHAAGYESASRFYQDMKGRPGMTASDWRDGGKGRTIHYAVVDTTLGSVLVAATERGVCRVAFGDGSADLEARFPKAELVQGGRDFRSLLKKVVAAVEAPGTGADIPLDVKGTAFQQRVWAALREIPPGETRSYGELAAALGNPKASRAVGGANGANGVAVLIPCHRVIAADGSLGGYAYGETIKRELLRREGAGD